MSYTYYDYLEIAPGASAARVEAAYVALLERFVCGTADAGQDVTGLLRMIHAAYEVLSDAGKRRDYDARLAGEAAMADAELKASLDKGVDPAERRVQHPPAALQSVVASIAA